MPDNHFRPPFSTPCLWCPVQRGSAEAFDLWSGLSSLLWCCSAPSLVGSLSQDWTNYSPPLLLGWLSLDWRKYDLQALPYSSYGGWIEDRGWKVFRSYFMRCSSTFSSNLASLPIFWLAMVSKVSDLVSALLVRTHSWVTFTWQVCTQQSNQSLNLLCWKAALPQQTLVQPSQVTMLLASQTDS